MRLRRTWASIRPRTRRGAVLLGVAGLVGAAALVAVLFAGAVMAWDPYVQYSVDRSVNARQWAALPLSFTSSGVCGSCHGTEQGRLVSATHAGIGCQSCHGALADHAAAGRGATAETVEVRVPTDAVCLRCHAQATGRPAGFRQIVPGQHYVTSCLECHDPHTGVANRPPVVEHPLANLPACLTCHGPEGFKARNQRHPLGSEDDRRCLECHAAGRGPAEDEQVSQ